MSKLIVRCMTAGALGILAIAALFLGYRFVKTDVEARVYQTRLAQLAGEYRTLQSEYNDAVRKSAVTELVVDQDKLYVRVRNALGTVSMIDTPFDPSLEIFLDVLVADGRLWVRRVYDQRTAPENGVVIDDHLGDIAWDPESSTVGRAVYRPLSEGRWVVRVTGNGSLTLERFADLPTGGIEELRAIGSPDDAQLTRLPPIEDFDEWTTTIDADQRRISWGDIGDALLGNRPTAPSRVTP